MHQANKDYFIDCEFISLSALRAIFGVWLNVCVAIIAICVRTVFRYRIKRSLISGRRRVSLWRVSPAVTTSEVFELRRVLIQALMRGHYHFVFASVFCVVAALVAAASTVISNYSVVTNSVIRDVVVQGQNVTHSINALYSLILDVFRRVEALDRANAPLDELFDFAPNDNFYWIYRANQWNNTWKGICTFTKYDAVDLVVYSTNTSRYQDEIPLLGNYIPTWATVNVTKQGTCYGGFAQTKSAVNRTGFWKNMIVTHFFGSSPDNDVTHSARTSNISIVNYLAHGIGRDPAGKYIETAFRSDVHVVECGFVRKADATIYQANAAGGSYASAAQGIGEMYGRKAVANSTHRLPVIQPTGMQMLRYWQGYMSVKDSEYPNPDVRTLAVVQDLVQIRLSSLVLTVGAFLVAVTAACVAKYCGVKYKTHKIHLPSSQLDWIVQAAREHAKTKPETAKARSRIKSSNEFAIHNQDEFFIVSPNFDACIAMDSDLSRLESPSSSFQSLFQEVDFDPWDGYSETRLFPT